MKKKVRDFGIALAVFVLIVGLYRWWRKDESYILYYILFSAAVLAVALFAPRFLRPVYGFWMKVARFILWINTVVLLSMVFFLVFATLALVFKLLKRDLLDERIDRDVESYWIRRPSPIISKERFKRLF